jgi:two-component system OmpR family sensor kinase
MVSERAPRRTFRRRLTATMTLLAITILAAASTAIYVRVRQTLLSHLDSVLLRIARAEAASVTFGPGGTVRVYEDLPPALIPPAAVGYEEFVQIKDARHQLVGQTENLTTGPALEPDAEAEAQGLAGKVVFADLWRGDEAYRGVYYPLRDTSGNRLVAVVAIPTRPLRRSLSTLLEALLLALVIGGGAAAFGASRLARRLTRPLEHIAAAARAISGTNLGGRMPDVFRDVELRQLVDVINDMLGRLEAAFVAQRRFVADASHELRSPLANLRGTVEVALRRQRAAEEYRESLTVALAEAERLSRLVEELLLLSRVEAEQLALDLCPCDLADITRGAVTAHAARGVEKSVELQLEAQPAAINGDAHRLRQVVDNLLDNALRHAPAGSAVVVRVGREDGTAVLAVHDTGPGLSPEDQAHVFDRLYRVDTSRGRDSGGLGLGLSIAKAIVEAHRGQVSVRSEPGEGCSFFVRLPLALETG